MHGMTGSVFVVLLMFGSAVEMFSARSAAAEPLVPQSQTDTEDSYIAGYAAAILERDFRVSSGAVRVQQGVIIVNAPNLVGAQQQKIVETLSTIRGVTRVELQENGKVLASTPAISPSAAAVQRDVTGESPNSKEDTMAYRSVWRGLTVLIPMLLLSAGCTQETQNQIGRSVQNWTGTNGVL